MSIPSRTFANLQPGIKTVDDRRVIGPVNQALQYLSGTLQGDVDTAIAAAVPDATTLVKGIVELATDAEAVAVTDTTRALTPSNFAGKAGQQTYVEASWTPALTFGGAAVGLTYASRSGVYTRVGRLVHFHLSIVLTAKGSSTGTMAITGPTSLTAAGETPLSVRLNSMTSGVGDTMISAVIGGGSTTLLIQKTATGNTAELTEADFTDTSNIKLSGTYRV